MVQGGALPWYYVDNNHKYLTFQKSTLKPHTTNIGEVMDVFRLDDHNDYAMMKRKKREI